MQTLQIQLLDEWSRSMEYAYRSALKLAEFAVETLDSATLGQINELTSRILSGSGALAAAMDPFSLSTSNTSPNKASRRVALVTGGIGGIGTEICKRLTSDGYRVIATHVAAEGEHAKSWCREHRGDGYEIETVECDVTNYDSCAKMAKSLETHFGGVDILVNCAGITRDYPLRKMDQEHWHAVLDTNLDSVFNVTRNFIDGMIQRHYGRVINISSVNGQKGQFGQTNYSAAKAGMIGFTRSLARELADHGITVNTVSPGYVKTKMVMAVPEEVRNGIIAKIPIGRLAEPAEIAHAVSFLAAENSGYITGSDLSVNGGLFMS